MPELPEVEVTRRRIEPHLVGRTIAALRTTAPSYFFLTPPSVLRRALRGRAIETLERRGKYLIARVDGGGRLVLHLGMTGQLFSSGVSSPRLLSSASRSALAPEQQREFQPDAHTHLRFEFTDGGPRVFLRDSRKFGKVLYLRDGEVHPRLERLGLDALRAEAEHLFGAARRRTVPIKTLLLDQAVLAGVGNIYADEALFLSGVRPGRRASRVTRRECRRICDSLRHVLTRSIETGGSSISDYVAPDGRDGSYQNERRVYARQGQPCRECATPIRRVEIGQRGTHFCPSCQT